MSKEIFDALRAIQQQSGVPADILIEKIKAGVEKAVRKAYHYTENIRIDFDPEAESFEMALLKTVVEGEPEDPDNEIGLDEARTYEPGIAVGQTCEIPIDAMQLGRVPASSAKQEIRNSIRQFERDKLIAQYQDKEHELVSATVQKVEPLTGNAIITIDHDEVYFPRTEQIPGETYRAGDIIKVYVVGIVNPEKKPSVRVSRSNREFVRRLFELEVPEIFDGTVEIKSVSREAGARSKIAVWSNNPDVDPIGACIGPKRARINAVMRELHGEKIDLIVYSEDDAEFISKALAPAEVKSVTLADDGTRSCRVTVPQNQLSLAIGNKGQNAKLAAKLTGYKIDITSEEQALEEAAAAESVREAGEADSEAVSE